MSQYTVKQGDTLWSIAKKLLGNGSRHSEIQRENNLRSDVIHPGQVLIIPGRGHSTTKYGATKYGTTSRGTALISENEFDKALTSNGYPAQPQKYNDFIQSCKYGSITTKSEAAMYLATLLHESSGLRVTEENHNPTSIAAYDKYIGRGYIQLSSIDNYRAASKFLGENYESDPEKVSRDPHAWNVSAWYWQDQVHQHVNQGFEATVTYGIRPLEPHFASRKRIYKNVCQALHVDQQP